MKSFAPAAIIIAIILIIDLYTFKGLYLLINRLKAKWLRRSILIGYWLITVFSVGATIWITNNITTIHSTRDYQTFFTLVGLVMLFVAPKLLFIVFHLADDLYFLVRKLLKKGTPPSDDTSSNITRAKFLTQIGLGAAAIPFGGMIYGMMEGRFDFRITQHKMSFKHLPASFSGLRIVQISDTHLGSFYKNFSAVKEAFSMIQGLRPDLIVFTGDMVNNYADEIDGWEPYFTGLEARYGKFAILGNHDYGDYVGWPSKKAKDDNHQALLRGFEKMDFKLLLNQNETLQIGDDAISLIGIENWGHGGFSKYGDLEIAMRGADQPFKILLSHDPSQWDAQVTEKTDIALTMSGHTHGMQFGLEVPGIKWSPAQYRYPRWGGAYTEGDQILYVNRGFGYIGFPGRVGIAPEITLIELNRG